MEATDPITLQQDQEEQEQDPFDLSQVMTSRSVNSDILVARSGIIPYIDYMGPRLSPEWRNLAPFQRDSLQFLDDPTATELLYLWPRGHGKSTLVTQLWPTYVIGKNHNVRIGIASNTLEQQAAKFLIPIDRILRSKLYHGVFGNLVPNSRDREYAWTNMSKTVIRSDPLLKDPTLQAIGAFGSSLGSRFDVILIDDLVDNETKNGLMAQRLSEWYYETLLPCLAPGGKLIIIGCLAAESRILMSTGVWKSIADVAIGESVWSVDNTGHLLVKKVKAVIPQGIHPTLKVTTAHHQVIATPNHPFMTLKDNGIYEWKRADQLSKDDVLLTISYIPSDTRRTLPNGRVIDNEFMWFFGYLMGDGCVVTSGKRVCLCVANSIYPDRDERVRKEIERLFERRPYETSYHNMRIDAVASIFLREWGIDGGAKGKRIPEWIFKLRPCLKRAFLRGLVDADGAKLSLGKGYRIELANKELIEDIYLLALTCWVRPTTIFYRRRFVQPPNSPAPVDSETYSIGLTFLSPQEKEGHTFRRCIPRHIQRFRLEHVTAIENYLSLPVYDLTVEDTHSFIAEGCVVHNTIWSDGDLYDEIIRRWKQVGNISFVGNMEIGS